MSTLTELESRIEELERRPPPVDNLQPNVLVLNPDGTIGALFTGGVQMIEGVGGSVDPGKALTFIDAGHTIREFVDAFKSGAAHQIQIASQADGIDSALLNLNSSEGGAAGTAVLTASASTSNGNASASVLDDRGRSSFLRTDAGGLVTPVLSGAAHGTLSWPGGSYDSSGSIFTCPGCVGNVFGVMSVDALSNGAGLAACRCQNLGNGTLFLQATQVNRSIGTPAAAVTIGYQLLWWGA